MKPRSSWPAVASTIRLIRGKGKLSFGQAKLTSVKSMQSHHFPFSFLTRTTLANKSSFLLHGFDEMGDIQLVDDNCWVNSSHVLLLPSQYFHSFL